MTPYRAAAEPEPEVLWSTPVAKLTRRRSAMLAGTVGATLGGTSIAIAAGLPVVGGVFFAVFLGAAIVAGTKLWLFERNVEARGERVGTRHRLRITRTRIELSAPFEIAGASRMTVGDQLLVQLALRGSNLRRVTIGAIVDSSDEVPTQDDWFDGARLASSEDAGEFMVEKSKRLVELRDVLSALD